MSRSRVMHHQPPSQHCTSSAPCLGPGRELRALQLSPAGLSAAACCGNDVFAWHRPSCSTVGAAKYEGRFLKVEWKCQDSLCNQIPPNHRASPAHGCFGKAFSYQELLQPLNPRGLGYPAMQITPETFFFFTLWVLLASQT